MVKSVPSTLATAADTHPATRHIVPTPDGAASHALMRKMGIVGDQRYLPVRMGLIACVIRLGLSL